MDGLNYIDRLGLCMYGCLYGWMDGWIDRSSPCTGTK